MSMSVDLPHYRIFEDFFPLPTRETLGVIGFIRQLPFDDVRHIAALNLGQASMGALGFLSGIPTETATPQSRHPNTYLVGAVLGELVARDRSHSLGISLDTMAGVFDQLRGSGFAPAELQYPPGHTLRNCSLRHQSLSRAAVTAPSLGQFDASGYFEDPMAIHAQLQEFGSLHTRTHGCPRSLEHGFMNLLNVYGSLPGKSPV